MQLKAYLKTLTPQQRIEFAERCGTNLPQLKHFSFGVRKPREAMAISIEKESDGAVTCEELLPDVDWQYLRGTKPKKRKAA